MQQKNRYLLPLVLVTSLFFLWGLAYGLLDVLNKHFQDALRVNKQQSTLLQMAYFGAYFLMALPAGLLMQRLGYKKGIITGLLLYAAGAILFYPAAENASFTFFLVALFILASGLAFLETAANPYITVLGDPATAPFRLNLAQSFNGVGSFIGPMIGGALFFSGNENAANLDSVQWVYLAIAGLVMVVVVLFVRTRMPELREEEQDPAARTHVPLWQQRHFVWAVVTQFFYVAAQVGIAALFINYCTESGTGIDSERAAYLLSASLLLFTIGRFAGTALMKWMPAHRLLALYAFASLVLSAVIIAQQGMLSIYALVGIFFFESIMFPTIFALGVRNLGAQTKKGSSFIIMAIVGGALVPYAMGYMAETYDTATAYSIPLLCFLVVLLFGLAGYKIKQP